MLTDQRPPLTTPAPTEQTVRVMPCPTCGQSVRFTFGGEQRWPLRVAEISGLGPLVHLWVCSACLTTITETAPEA